MKKTDLIHKLKQLQGISDDERAYLINLVNTKKKYGLVWEDKPEDVEEQLRENLPVLKEVKDRAIINGEEYPNHILIEGDNLHALTALTFTHEGKIDVIYIDPPYNTGNKDFKYNDTFVDKEDSYRHSKWLSFMVKRLKIAKRLLNEKGVIFISIDDNEASQLKIICDEIFSENALIGKVIWKNVTDNNPTNIAHEHEYILCYAKNPDYISPVWKSTRSYVKEILLKVEKELLEKHKSQEFLEKEYKTWFRENKVFLGELDRYKYIDFDGIYTGSQSVHNPGKEGYRYDVIHPITKKPCKQPLMGYRFPESTMKQLIKDEKILYGDDHNKIVELKVYAKDYQFKFSSLFELDGRLGANELRELFHEKPKVFNNPKPVDLLKHIFSFATQGRSIILDFFAGSGSSLHAAMELSSEDNIFRQCILVTNNENNICEEVTYERNKRVIHGYTNAKGDKVEGLTSNNLRYYKSDFVPSNKSEQNKRALTQLSTDLLCIKEDCYTDVTGQTHFSPTQCRIFKDCNNKYMVIVYHSRNLTQVCERLITYIPTIPTTDKVRLYVFSPEKETLLEEFQDIEDKIIAAPLPDAIYNAYRATFKTLKLDKKPLSTPVLHNDITTETDLFFNTDEA